MAKCYACGGSVRKMAEGGFVSEEEESGFEPMLMKKKEHYVYHDVPNQEEVMDDMLDDDLVDGIIHERKYSEGGQVANDTGEGQEVDKMPNQFDDLVKRDDLEFSYTGENSGDYLGDESLDDEEMELIDGIMRSRKKKGQMPHPA